jgi:hypothetical protein
MSEKFKVVLYEEKSNLEPTIAIPHTNTIKGIHRDGCKYFRARLLGTY